ncbi:S8 family peptidase [Actinokineospora sp. NBRC 105648]|uniref:S8 family peptidase n=1 Tax=Actinokineospora sp. NBRC 105648 TaxID=3032206 RepID=UPI0024A4963A|nr:S8 family peptidase [Actinokineospora sp. NBRC 105648]GLZ39853.1 serine protease [Actinokineospora sp. NBRC 105648]
MIRGLTMHKRYRTTLVLGALAATGALAWVPMANAAPTAPAAPAASAKFLSAATQNTVPDRYIVVLADTAGAAQAQVSSQAQTLAGRYSGQVRRVYDSALRGFSVRMSESKARELAADPSVSYVQPVQIGHGSGTQPNPPSWGLDRVDQRNLPLDSSYTYDTTASNVTAYVIDSGIRMTHQDFGGRAKSGYDFVDDDTNASDCLGHGSHVAGTIGGSGYGVAKAVNIVSVRILTCNDSVADDDAVAGVNWITKNAAKPAVANMSLQFGSSAPALETAIKNSIAGGVTWVLSANNFNSDACQSSPAKIAEAITVGNITKTDTRRSDSNYGSCLDIWAPGDNIVSVNYQNDTGNRTMSGTSMAAPHVAGAAALYLSANPSATPKQVRDALVAQASTITVGDAKAGSPNKVLYARSGGTTPPTTCPAVTNGADVNIPDNGAAVTSSAVVSGCSGNASGGAKVAVDIKHTFRGDLVVDLVAPDGSVYNLKPFSANDSADNITATYTVNASTEVANGTWKLRVQDKAANDTGYINSWTLTV